MCRLYGMLANEETKVECTLVHAQNALMVQSRRDLAGHRHGHGWGVATYRNHLPDVSKQAWAAYHGEHFKRAAARIYSRTVVAHVRQATVGPPSPDAAGSQTPRANAAAAAASMALPPAARTCAPASEAPQCWVAITPPVDAATR